MNELIASVIDNKNNGKSMTNCANVENIVEYIRNVDPKQFANIRDEVFEVFEMEVDFEKIMDQDSDEEMLSNTSYASDSERV